GVEAEREGERCRRELAQVSRPLAERVGDERVDAFDGDPGRVVVCKAGEALQDLPERPVRNAVAVRQAAADDDQRRLGQGRQPLEQLAGESALADARLAVDRHQVWTALGEDALVQREQELELALTADERGANAGQAARRGIRLLRRQQERPYRPLLTPEIPASELLET